MEHGSAGRSTWMAPAPRGASHTPRAQTGCVSRAWAALAERGYNEATLHRALTKGVDPHGREFQYYMPRWALDDAETKALAAYLKQL